MLLCAAAVTALENDVRYDRRPPAVDTRAGGTESVRDYGHLPLHFERNEGQADDRVDFLSRGDGYRLFLTPTEAVLSLRGADPQPRPPDEKGRRGRFGTHRSKSTAVVRMTLVGANARSGGSGRGELPGKSHYLIGRDPNRWRTDVPLYGRVSYHDVYPGIDLVYYGNQRQLEYDFVVSPGADPGSIRLAFEGPEAVTLDETGNLLLETNAGRLVQHAPIVYQEVEGERKPVAGSYIRHGEAEVGFSLGAYDADLPLVIDPVLAYSTYLGGSGTESSSGIAVDGSGSAYVVGTTQSSDLPTLGAYQATLQGTGTEDVFVTKLSPSGSSLVYSTYLGGSDDDVALGIAVDASGAAYVTGGSASTDFPMLNPVQGTHRGGWQDVFVTKLSPSGSSLVYSTYLGGDSPDAAYGIAVDASGSAYVAGETYSPDYPTSNAYQAVLLGYSNVFVSKLSPSGATLAYSTYLGGSDFDSGWAIAVDASGAAYVTGGATSLDFPLSNPYQATHQGGWEDVFVTKLSPSGSSLVYSTYLGRGDWDHGYAIAVDASGAVYITGCTGSTDFPTLNAYQATHQGSGDVFVTKLSPSGTALVYSTFLGGSGGDLGYSIAVDAGGSAFVTGEAGPGFPTVGAYQAANRGLKDAFVSQLSPSGSTLVHSTYLGGSANEYGIGIRVDAAGNTYVAGASASADFPTVSPYQATSQGLDVFVAKFAPRQDLLWHQQTTGELYEWVLHGSALASGSYLTPDRVVDTTWQVRGLADFDGDGDRDILWHRQTTGELYVWLMQGTVRSGGSYLTPDRVADLSWQIRGLADFDLDGDTDILWHRQTTGELYVWQMDGPTPAGRLKRATGTYLQPSPITNLDWQIRGVADFNGDQQPDLLWHHQGDGTLYVWFLNGTTMTSGAYPSRSQVPDTNWQVRKVADFNGDDQPDLLWHHRTTGDLYVWYMNGLTLTRGSYLTPSRYTNTNWQIVAR